MDSVLPADGVAACTPTASIALSLMWVKIIRADHKASLEKNDFGVHTDGMTSKQIVEDLLQRVPDNVSLQASAREIEFIAVVRQGFTELDRGGRIPIEEIERELPSWIIR